MELTKKTTVLFTPEQHRTLRRLAEQRGTSMGELVREACALQYGLVDPQTRLEAVRELGTLALPVGSPAEMKREAVPDPESLLS